MLDKRDKLEQSKIKKCIFCDWERLFQSRNEYDWNYVCPKCQEKIK